MWMFMTCFAIVWSKKVGIVSYNEREAIRKETYSISSFVVLVLDDEDHVETRQDSGLEIDVLLKNSSYQYRIGAKDNEVKSRLTSPGVFISS